MKIIIEGAGQVGSHLAKMLSHEGGDITVIDDNEGRLQKLNSTADVVTVVGDPSSVTVLRDAGCARADLFIAVNPFTTQTVNIVSALLAKRLGSKRVIARIEDEAYLLPENKLMFKDMGIDMLFYPEKIASDEIIDMLKHTASTDSMDFARGKLQLVVFRLDDDSPILDMKVAEFTAAMEAASAQAQLRIIAIARKGETIIPKFDTKFNYNDHLYIIAKREGVPTIMKFLGKDNIEVNKAMILGGSEIGEMVAAQLSSQQLEAVKLIEIDKDRCRELSEKLPSDVIVANGDCRNSDFLVEEGIREYDALVAVTGNDEANILACVVAKKFGVARTIAQVENLEYVRLAEDMGVDAVINKKLITAGRIFKFTLSDKVRFVRYMSGTDAEVLEYTAAPNSKVTKGALKDIGFPRNAIIGGIIRGSESFIAVGDTRIEPYDRVAVFALPETVKEVDRFFK
ncbi:MAG: Trk system potassium transporter TrkA [Bacteroidales bacterium]|jgi:trk system potassium uptake protein TrkA|nr:Trk system potassium transporter TrkA [Bacteroidales bacterium]